MTTQSTAAAATTRPERAPIWAGDRVRIEGNSTYLWGQEGTVLGRAHDEGRMPCWLVQLDQATGVGLPADSPAGPPLVFLGEALVRIS